ncbi:DNA cytosine methyltransferase [Xenorhabdus budapestensis]|uniref:Methyltransferase n=1 Tax=Xenorhabdus budapestensis TaxID=290110 RepID=A0A2D0J3T0_XENBU|nr:DNA cytosine methyltransferase [Xenorhabdus budapestensis]PHM29104.1 methyltransferase [Xenorhabdus budapestensis]
MTAYYNEIDPYAAQWLRNLIAAGHIAPGDVDERSIEDVKPDDLRNYTQCHFFAGIGVWSFALRNAGWPDDKPVWTGSCPCQPFSAAGKGAGFTDERHLWPAFFHLIEQYRPRVVFGEQVASRDGLAWFDLVHTDLEGTNYSVGATDICAAGIGAPHIRQRLYWVGHANNQMPQGLRRYGEIVHQEGWQDSKRYALSSNVATHVWNEWKPNQGADEKIRIVPPNYGKEINGTSNRVGRLRAYGNAIVAPVAEEFIKAYMQGV